jgi:hypothetical protein
MYQEFYQNSPHLIWPLVGLAIFFFSFLGVLFYVTVILRKNPVVDHMATLPLDDDESIVEEVRDND